MYSYSRIVLLAFMLIEGILSLPRSTLIPRQANSWLDDLPTFIRDSLNRFPGGAESPDSFILWDPSNPGSGPYPAKAWKVDALPRHTVYAPAKVDLSKGLPVILWGNGACMAVGTMFSELLKEFASYGYIVVANGDYYDLPYGVAKGKMIGNYHRSPLASLIRTSPLSDWWAAPLFFKKFTNSDYQMEAVAWLESGASDGRYGVPDLSRLASAGQGCGGKESYQIKQRYDKVKAIALFNTLGGKWGGTSKIIEDLRVPVGMFNGGPIDRAYEDGESDFEEYPKTTPAVKANIDAGHLGTYYAKNAGKFGKIGVAFLEATLKGNQSAKAMFAPDGVFAKDGWNLTARNWV